MSASKMARYSILLLPIVLVIVQIVFYCILPDLVAANRKPIYWWDAEYRSFYTIFGTILLPLVILAMAIVAYIISGSEKYRNQTEQLENGRLRNGSERLIPRMLTAICLYMISQIIIDYLVYFYLSNIVSPFILS